MPVFGKKQNCPTSFELLAFSSGEAEAFSAEIIERHLAFCDFCAAETVLYRRYPPVEESIQAPSIPKHLFELAESILKRKKLKIRAGEAATV
jgi:hypothetical protein